jgi:sigma-B regulation protein RsbU (phosphoserine phosphatase)
LKSEGYRVESVDHPAGILAAVRRETFQLILMDLNYTRDTTSGEEGLDVLAQLRRLEHMPPVLVMTAWGSVELAVEAMRRGARDFVLKPWDNAKLLEVVRAQLASAPAGPSANSDLELARRVQSRLLATTAKPLATLRAAGICRQAGAVGGDYFDFLDLGPGRLGLVLADISGKGIAAALLMAHLQASIRSLAWQAPQNLALLLRTLNLLFRESTAPEHFATLFFADYDDARRVLRWANCGHPAPLLERAGGALEQLDTTASILGVFEPFEVGVVETPLAPGDRLLIYSDGASEALEDLGNTRISQLFAAYQGSPEEAPAALAERIDRITGGALPDDCTLIYAAAR